LDSAGDPTIEDELRRTIATASPPLSDWLARILEQRHRAPRW
jgi:hypothetical protein